jgi:hypothetical protein
VALVELGVGEDLALLAADPVDPEAVEDVPESFESTPDPEVCAPPTRILVTATTTAIAATAANTVLRMACPPAPVPPEMTW